MKRGRKSREEYDKNRKRNINIHIMATEEEVKKIDENAVSCGLTRTEYMIRQAIDGEVKFEEHDDLFSVANELNRIGININQAVRNMNEMGGMVYAEDAKVVRESMNRAKEILEKRLNAL